MIYTDVKTSQNNFQSDPQLDEMALSKISVAAMLDRGKVREINEDNYYRSDHDPNVNHASDQLFLIVDGVGGDGGGNLAGLIACKKMPQHFFDPAKTHLPLSTRLREAIDRTHQDIVAAGEKSKQFNEISCTFVAFAVSDGEAVIANMGDSRAYCLRDRHLYQLTVDHNVAQELFSLGYLDSHRVNKHHSRHQLTRALGGHKKGIPDIRYLHLQAGDRYILCSDGLHNVVSDKEILEKSSQAKSISGIVKDLVQATNHYGAPDNIAVMALAVSECD